MIYLIEKTTYLQINGFYKSKNYVVLYNKIYSILIQLKINVYCFILDHCRFFIFYV